MRRLLLSALIAVIGFGPAHAGTLESFIDSSRLRISSTEGLPEECLSAPLITTSIQIQNPELTPNKPRDLRGFHSKTGVLQGLAHMAYGFEVSFGLERISSSQGFCVRIASMDVKAGHVKPQIWVRPELQKGTCAYDTTIEHELEHVQNFHDHLRRFDVAVRRELHIAMRANAYYRVESMADAAVAEERLKAEAMEAVSAIHDRSYQIANDLDQRMDSPSEYRRLSNICR
jgi:hypothetical protein